MSVFSGGLRGRNTPPGGAPAATLDPSSAALVSTLALLIPVRYVNQGMVLRLGAALVVALSLMGVAAPIARADAVDNKFLAALTSRGINSKSPQAAIIAAHEVCDELSLGKSSSSVASEVMQNSNLPAHDAGYFVGVSIGAFCPNYSS
jgi:hypothetical protein